MPTDRTSVAVFGANSNVPPVIVAFAALIEKLSACTETVPVFDAASVPLVPFPIVIPPEPASVSTIFAAEIDPMTVRPVAPFASARDRLPLDVVKPPRSPILLVPVRVTPLLADPLSVPAMIVPWASAIEPDAVIRLTVPDPVPPPPSVTVAVAVLNRMPLVPVSATAVPLMAPLMVTRPVLVRLAAPDPALNVPTVTAVPSLSTMPAPVRELIVPTTTELVRVIVPVAEPPRVTALSVPVSVIEPPFAVSETKLPTVWPSCTRPAIDTDVPVSPTDAAVTVPVAAATDSTPPLFRLTAPVPPLTTPLTVNAALSVNVMPAPLNAPSAAIVLVASVLPADTVVPASTTAPPAEPLSVPATSVPLVSEMPPLVTLRLTVPAPPSVIRPLLTSVVPSLSDTAAAVTVPAMVMPVMLARVAAAPVTTPFTVNPPALVSDTVPVLALTVAPLRTVRLALSVTVTPAPLSVPSVPIWLVDSVVPPPVTVVPARTNDPFA